MLNWFITHENIQDDSQPEYEVLRDIQYNHDIHYQIVTFLGLNYHHLSYHYALLKHRNIHHFEILNLRNQKKLVALLTFFYSRYQKNKNISTIRVFAHNWNYWRYQYGLSGVAYSN